MPTFTKLKSGSWRVQVRRKQPAAELVLHAVLGARVRPGARYFHSVRLLQRVKELDAQMFTKSGIMVGLGEEGSEVQQLMDDLRSADVDFLTIGQYLQPRARTTLSCASCPPDELEAYEKVAYAKGFLLVSATPLTRSSHHAGDDFRKLRERRRGLAPAGAAAPLDPVSER